MHNLAKVLALSALLGLAGCGGGGDAPADKPAAKKEGKAAAPNPGAKGAAIRFRPGRWETVMKMEKLDLGNVPPQVRQAIQGGMGRTMNVATCLTPEQAQQPDSKFFGRKDGNCTMDEYSAKGGRIEAKMTCKVPEGTQTTSMSGTYSAESYAMTMSTSGSANGMPMLMTMSMEARRTGDCTGDEGR